MKCFTRISVTSAESIGDIAGTVIGGANRQPTSRELSGGVMADGLSSSFAAMFNAFPQVSFRQNVGLVALTGVASRYVVAIGGGFLVIEGLFPRSALRSAFADNQSLYEHASTGVMSMLESGLIPGAIVSILLNLVLPGIAVVDHGDDVASHS